jgi:integrase
MPSKPNNAPIVCQFFTWRLFQRDGVYYADGRTAGRNLGKHSLGTRDHDEALANLRLLDSRKAVELGMAPAAKAGVASMITVEAGWELYLDYCDRPQVLGGASAATQQRYQAVRDKHVKFCSRHGFKSWADVNKAAVQAYGNWLDKKPYADRSIFLELTLLKSVIAWLIAESHLPRTHAFELPLIKPKGTDTYCYTQEQVAAMAEHCRATSGLAWLGNVIIALACSGMRISELAGLRWSDLDLKAKTIRVADERASSRKRKLGTARTTKGRRSRSIPIHPDLAKLLVALVKHPDGRVFHAARGGPLRPNNTLHGFVDQVIEPLERTFPTPEGDIGFKHGRLHSFRHFFCSQCFLGGASEGEIKEWLGHADSKMVEHYRHLRSEDALRKMEQVDFLGRRAGDDRSSGVA